MPECVSIAVSIIDVEDGGRVSSNAMTLFEVSVELYLETRDDKQNGLSKYDLDVK